MAGELQGVHVSTEESEKAWAYIVEDHHFCSEPGQIEPRYP
jgi:hypothetical protein